MSLREKLRIAFEEIEKAPTNHLPENTAQALVDKAKHVADDFSRDILSGLKQPLADALVQCAPVIIAGLFLFKTLEAARKKQFSQGLPQRSAHDLVDRWARLQAERALFIELCEEGVNPGKGVLLPARLESLTREIQQSVLDLAEALGEGGNLVEWAPVADWAVQSLGSQKISSFDGSIAQALRAEA